MGLLDEAIRVSGGCAAREPGRWHATLSKLLQHARHCFMEKGSKAAALWFKKAWLLPVVR